MIKTLSQLNASDLDKVGGKCIALARLHQNGFPIPKTVSLSTDVYEFFIENSGLRSRIQMEINRKEFADMRWEEIWDAALRIRNLFLRTPMPEQMSKILRDRFVSIFKNTPVAVRSSSPGEDAVNASFAGLHESFVNIIGADSILDHVRLVWASLWSDAAMLYRKEIGLDVNDSKMAVVVQEMIDGDKSGVIFTRNPIKAVESVIEAVHGLNQGLVDGVIEPDRWTLDNTTGKILSHVPGERKHWMIPGHRGAVLSDLPALVSLKPPLDPDEIDIVFKQATASEALFDYPQDMEWTFKKGKFYVLQSRPISTGIGERKSNERGWYLSLRRSLENLKRLRHRIEQELIVDMEAEADMLASMDIENLTDHELGDEIERRQDIYRKWKDIYWSDFIPFAHGMRLFGQFYNDAVQPEDPFEFVTLLETSELKSIQRNLGIEAMAEELRRNPSLKKNLESGRITASESDFAEKATHFLRQYMEVPNKTDGSGTPFPEMLVSIILNMAKTDPKQGKPEPKSRVKLEEAFLNRFEGEDRDYATELLDLGRASYRLRDDDNIVLGQIEREVFRAGKAGKERLGMDIHLTDALEIVDEIAKTLKGQEYVPEIKKSMSEMERIYDLKARQIIGQPAGPGFASGPARIIGSQADLGLFQRGEVLVCDAIDPNMTLIVPMAAAIIERRGGMLIHGAIIAREYGIPCVTGVPDATQLIHTGDRLTVDGFLGIVTIGRT